MEHFYHDKSKTIPQTVNSDAGLAGAGLDLMGEWKRRVLGMVEETIRSLGAEG